ncbi:serine hydrolase domain-containing protein [Kribbella sp. NPDC056861]|uniref:serine hydrolase domain-containing protein n=1 Tax=Kribbella sp. NPDC056861 TaxID=3154857 RepID=UPI00342AAEE4
MAPALGAGPVDVVRSDELDPAALDKLVQQQSRALGVPGVAYAVVGPDSVQHKAAFGVDGDDQPVSPQTPFLWGSVSKPITATLVTLLARDGRLNLDAAVAKLVPSFTTADPESAARITVRQLLDHTSGLPEGLELTDRYDASRSVTSLLPQIADLEPVAAPGSKHSYSSLNYVVLGAVVESVTGKPFAQVLSDRLLKRAGVASPLADAAQTGQVLPPGHRFLFGTTRAFKTQVDPATVPAGYLVGSADDLAAYARTQLRGGPVLTETDRTLLHTTQVPVGDNNGYALGWRTSQIPGTDEPMIWHGGAAPGYQAAIVLLPKRAQAIVVLQNAYSPFHDTALMDTAFGVAALLAATTPEKHSTDPIYPALLIGLGLLSLTLLTLTLLSVLRLLRGAKPGTSRRTLREVNPGGVQGSESREVQPVSIQRSESSEATPGSVRRRKPRVAKPRSTRRRLVGLALSLLVLGALAFALASVLPGLAGVSLGQLSLWAPDLSWLVHVALILCGALAVVRVLVTVLHARSAQTQNHHLPAST